MTTATYTIDEAAQLLGIGVSGAYRAARQGTLPVDAIRVGGRWLIPRRPLDQLLGLTETAD